MRLKSRINFLLGVVALSVSLSACDTAVSATEMASQVAEVQRLSTAGASDTHRHTSRYGEALPVLRVEDDFKRAAILTTRILSTFEYNKQPLDEALASRLFDAYFDALDPQRMFFLASDIEQFEDYRPTTAIMLAHGELGLAFEIYERYRERVQQRYDYLFTLLDGEHQVDFSLDETFGLDRKDLPWPRTVEELNDLWRKRLKNDILRLKLVGQSEDKILERLRRRYTNNEKLILQTDSEDVAELYLNAYGDSTDPHTSYFSPSSAENFNVQLSLSVDGIGAVLQKRDEYAQIREVVAGGPAARSGQIHPGDRIVAVGQGEDAPMEDVIDWRLDDIVAKIRGERGTVVRIEILPGDEGLEAEGKVIRLVRDRVLMEEQAARLKTLEVEADGQRHTIGVITIPSFYEDFEGRSKGQKNYKSLTRDVKAMLEELNAKGASAVVLDLRNNGGGSLTEAANLSGLFIGPRNHIVQVKDTHERISHVRSDQQARVWDKPVVVLVNLISASASEIFAAVIQDYGRGMVVGDDTWGKGTVQTLTDLSDFINRRHVEEPNVGALKWTIQMFFRVNGESTQAKGVVPDIHFPSHFNHEELGESSYPNALPWTKIEPVAHDGFRDMAPIIKQVKRRHDERTEASESWQLMVDEVNYSRFLADRKEVSLNYETRQQEREAMEAQRQAFNDRREALGETDVGVFQLDDGLQFGEGDLREELEREKRRKENLDTAVREAANIAADLVHYY